MIPSDPVTPTISISEINETNIPMVLVMILGRIDAVQKDQASINEKLDRMDKTLQDHTKCLEVFQFSRCTLLPWLGRNKWVLTVIMAALTLYLSAIDWVNRELQWSLLPPRVGP